MHDLLERHFRLAGHGTSVRTELVAGLTTFLTMAYIILVQPAALSGAMFGRKTGMDFGAVTTATCLAAALASAMMLRTVSKIDWDDPTESVPAFLTLLGIPLSYSIADGLALGFISYSVIKLLTGRGRSVHWGLHVLAVLLVLYFAAVRARLG